MRESAKGNPKKPRTVRFFERRAVDTWENKRRIVRLFAYCRCANIRYRARVVVFCTFKTNSVFCTFKTILVYAEIDLRRQNLTSLDVRF